MRGRGRRSPAHRHRDAVRLVLPCRLLARLVSCPMTPLPQSRSQVADVAIDPRGEPELNENETETAGTCTIIYSAIDRVHQASQSMRARTRYAVLLPHTSQ